MINRSVSVRSSRIMFYERCVLTRVLERQVNIPSSGAHWKGSRSDMHVNHSVAGHRCPHIGHTERAKPNLDPARSPRPDCVQLRLRLSLSDCVSTKLVSTSQQLASLPMAPPCDWPLELLQLAALVCQVGIGEDQNAVERCWP